MCIQFHPTYRYSPIIFIADLCRHQYLVHSFQTTCSKILKKNWNRRAKMTSPWCIKNIDWIKNSNSSIWSWKVCIKTYETYIRSSFIITTDLCGHEYLTFTIQTKPFRWTFEFYNMLEKDYFLTCRVRILAI